MARYFFSSTMSIRLTLAILLLPMLPLAPLIVTGYASMGTALLPGDVKHMAGDQTVAQSQQYRLRVEALMHSNGYWKRLFRHHRSYPYAQRAIDLSQASRLAEALKVYNQYLKKDPEHLLMQWDRLVLLEIMKDNRQMEIAASQFLNIVPDFGPVLILRANARKAIKLDEQAESDWERALQDTGLTDADRWMAMSEIAFSAYRRKAYNKSLEWCTRLMQNKPPTVDEMIFRAGLLEKTELWQAAQAQWQVVIDKKPSPKLHRQAILAKAFLLQKLQDPKAAFETLTANHKQALFDSTDTPDSQRKAYYLTLAQLSAQLSCIGRAIQYYEKLNPATLEDSIRFDLARLYAIDKQQNKILPLLFSHPEVSLDNTDALKHMLDVIHQLTDHKEFRVAGMLLNKSFQKFEQNFQKNTTGQDSKTLWVHYLAAKAAISGQNEHRQQKASSLAQLASITGEFQHQMDYADFLLTNQEYIKAIAVLEGMVCSWGLSSNQYAQAYAALAYAFGRTNQFTQEAHCWYQAYTKENKPIYRLYEIQAWQSAGEHQTVAHIAQNFPVHRLGLKEQVAWYETAAHAWQQIGETEKSGAAWQKAAELQSTPRYHCQASDILISQGDLQGALAEIEKALVISPGYPQAMKRLAYINIRQGNDEKATALLERLKNGEEMTYQLSADLGYAYARMGKNELAYQNLVASVDQKLSESFNDPKENGESQSALASMRSQISEIDRRYEVLIADSFYSLNNDDGLLKLPSSSQWFNMGIGMVELGFRPPKIGYDSGRILTFFGRVMWPNRSDSISPENDSLQAGLGVRYKPFKQTNVLFSAEQLFGLGDAADDYPILHIAHSATHIALKADGSSDASFFTNYLPYRQYYTDLAKAFDDNQSWLFSHETRMGDDLSHRDNRLYLLFGYLQGNAIMGNDDNFSQIQTGIGLSFQWLGKFDRYRGYRREAELLLRCGYVVYESNNDLGLSTLLGIRFSFY